ncbi:MAG: aliphatic sulfonate ABC transporter substrate-binding protein [Bosea sp. (in: a-proteobacteria)]
MPSIIFNSVAHSRRQVLHTVAAGVATAFLAFFSTNVMAQSPREIRIDFATYNPVSLVLKERGILDKALASEGVSVRWVQSAGSNKALEFLNAGSIDFGSTAGAAALIARVNGNPIRSVYVFSRPEWTALVTTPKSGIKQVSDLKGKRVAVTRGTDPHIFLLRALAEAKLTEKDVKLVLLQHQDGKLALERGDVDAWAGLDPLMAAAEIETGAVLFHRKAADNTWGILNVREEFAQRNPALVRSVLQAYEDARKWSVENPDELRRLLVAFTKLPEPVVARQLERTELTHGPIGQAQIDTIVAAGEALKVTGILPAGTNIPAVVDGLLDRRFTSAAR